MTTPAQKDFFLKPSHQFTVVEQLDRFDVDVAEKPFFVLPSELSSFIRNQLHLKVPVEAGVSDMPGRVSDVPKYHVLKSSNDVSVALFRASPQLYVCRRSTQASIFVCTASPYCVSTGPIFFPWANTFACIVVQAVRVFSWHVPSSAAWHPASCLGISPC